MTQKHFPDDPIMGTTFAIDGHKWVVVDVWVDIGAKNGAPLNVSLDREDGEDFGLHLPKATVLQMAAAT